MRERLRLSEGICCQVDAPGCKYIYLHPGAGIGSDWIPDNGKVFPEPKVRNKIVT